MTPLHSPAPSGHSIPTTVWRCGDKLVVVNGTMLPQRCIKTGGPVEKYVLCRVAWNSGWQTLRAMISPARLVTTAMGAQQGFLHVGLSKSALRWQWFWRIVAALGVVGIFYKVFASGPSHEESPHAAFGAFFLGLFLSTIWMALMLPILRTLKVWKFEGNYIFLKGVHPSILQGLPEWPHVW